MRKLVIFNCHGGQRAHVDQIALRLRADCGMLVVPAHSFAFGTPADLFDADELMHGLHVAAVETSLMLHMRPDLVQHDALAGFPVDGAVKGRARRRAGLGKAGGPGLDDAGHQPDGACGNATAATAAKAKRLQEHWADRLVMLLGEVARHPLP